VKRHEHFQLAFVAFNFESGLFDGRELSLVFGSAL